MDGGKVTNSESSPYVVNEREKIQCERCSWLCGKHCYVTVNELRSAAKARCRICELRAHVLETGLLADEWYDGNFKVEIDELDFGINQNHKWMMECRSGCREGKDEVFRFEIFTLPERMLFKRILHFATGKILWEWREYTTCECHPRDGSSLQFNSMSLWKGKRPPVFSEDPDKACFEMVALSRRIQETKNGEPYLAGLWKDNIRTGLMWRVSHPCRNSIRPHKPSMWRAPSWSWASVDGVIDYTKKDTTNLHPDFKVLEACTTLAGPDPTGQVESGTLTVAGHTTWAEVRLDF
ncbi:hypothetical protein B0H63DRAFT_557299 [Podospora didyma]|uniref:Heterokaryon incompatibility domain-containing protein n=1 Tax=Podospora didyma TaxID=330526 RepID=A0AAE0U4B7_9PEZI|nr:hypothetical protein B0H63DRAFT_557299 [Podospora didyma]